MRSSASCGESPRSTTFATKLRWLCGWIGPPIEPNAIHGAPSAEQHAGDDGVERPLAGRQRIPVSRLEAETGAAVLEHDAGVAAADARAEAGCEALDERDEVAFAVGRAEVDGVARPARRRRLERALADERRAPARVRLVEERRDRDVGVLRVGDVLVAVGEGELHRLDAPVPVERARRVGGLERLEHVERDERREALAVRRELRDLDAAVRRRDRLDPASTRATRGRRARGSRPPRATPRRSRPRPAPRRTRFAPCSAIARSVRAERRHRGTTRPRAACGRPARARRPPRRRARPRAGGPTSSARRARDTAKPSTAARIAGSSTTPSGSRP